MRDQLRKIEQNTGWEISLIESTPSTNDTIRLPQYCHGSVIIAEQQSAGRGEGGTYWQSNKGENLTFSILIEPDDIAAADQFRISKIVCLALCQTLEEFGINACIKWPNDIYIGNSKAAGILIENDIAGNKVIRSIIGIGLNVNQCLFDPALPNPSSMCIATGSTLDRVAVLGIFLEIFQELLANNGKSSPQNGDMIDTLYLELLFRRGEMMDFIEKRSGSIFRGTISDIGPHGEMIITDTSGSPKSYIFKEIEYIL